MDSLKQYAKIRQQLIEEKSRLESRLAEINQVLGSEATSPQRTQATTRGERRGRGRANALSMREAVVKALSKGPLARKDLAQDVVDAGYVFTTNNPLNSIGAILYGKNSPVKRKGGKFYLTDRAAQASDGDALPAPVKKKPRKKTPEGTARIAAAARARWAKQKAGK